MNKNIKYLIEDIVNFNPVDYSEEDPDLIDRETVAELTYKYYPKTKEELQKIIVEKLKENINYPYLNNIDTSEITDMSSLFSGHKDDYLYKNGIDSTKIIKLNISAWDTSNVTNMGYMFCKCKSLKELNISKWNTSNVTDMSLMFYRCRSLEELDISAWDTLNLINMSGMFYECESLEKLDLSGWDTSNVINMSWIFFGCDESIIPDWYKNKKGLTESTLNFNPIDYPDEDHDLIDNQTISNLTYKYFPKDKKELWDIIVEKLKENIKEPYLNDIDTSKVTDMECLFSNDKDDYLYKNGISSNKIIKLDLSNWNTSSVTDMSGMFYNCESLEELNISCWDMSNVTDIRWMFQYCESLKELDLSGWDTSSVTDMSGMFYSCESLIKLDLSGWDTSNVTDMCDIFCECSSLKELNLSGWDISHVYSASCMFYGCKSLKKLNLSGLDTSDITDIDDMFDGCKKQIIPSWYKKRLTESTLNFNPADYNDDSVVSNNEVSNILYKYHPQNIFELWEILAEKLEQNIKYPNLSDIDISNLDSLKSLFSSLRSDYLWAQYAIDTAEIVKLDLSTWDTSNIKDMSGMFYSCVSLEEVNISGWDFSNIQETDYMFYKCMSLDKINGNINISKIPSKENMFFGCKAHIIPKEYIPLMSDYEKAWMMTFKNM